MSDLILKAEMLISEKERTLSILAD